MAVEECMKQVFSDEDDDDAPLIFKRNNTSSRQSKPSSEPRKVSSKKCDVSSGKQSSDKSALNGEASNSQKAKAPSATLSSGKQSSDKSALNGEASNSQMAKAPSATKSSAQKSTTANSVSTNLQSKQSMVSKMVSHMSDDTKRIHLDKPSSEANNPEDSDDDIPLNFRSKGASVDVRKNNALNATKSSAQKSTTVTVKSMFTDSQSKQSMEGKMASDDTKKTHLEPYSEANSSEDSDDYKPLSITSKGTAVEVQKSKSLDAKRALKPLSGNTSENNDRKKMKLDNSSGGAEDSVASDDGEVIGRTYFSGSVTALKNTSSHQMKIVGPLTTTSPVQKIKEDVANNSDDSEDDKPLSKSTVGAFIKKLPESNEEKPVLKTKESCKKDPDDSDDDVPLVNRFQSKSNVGLNGSRKDLGAKTGNKRPLSDGNNSTESSLKKAKMSDTSTTVKVKHEPVVKKEPKTEDDDNIPFAQRLKKSASSNKQSSDKKMRKVVTSPLKKGNKKINKTMKNSKYSKSTTVPPESGGAKKWTTLEHSGVIFPPPYKPHGVKMLYNGQPVDLTPGQEEVATMFAVMKDTDYASKPKFVENFMNDWRQILGRNHVIKKFELCDFTPIYEWHLNEKEKKKQMTTEDKKALKEEKLKVEEKYMWATVDGVKEKVGNFRVEPPGLFRGRGEHPKMGKLKKRIHPRDITINIGKKAPIPECPVPGERWKEVRHDNTVTWLAYWLDPINQKEFKYVFLAASSSLKGQSDKEKYEKARLLKNYIHQIRANYTKDFSSKDATRRQISVATYLIDKLALRAGNEKDDDEADTVGCCTLKVENVVLVPPNKLQFDFLGKDSIRYFNTVEVELPVYKAIGDFRTAKKHDGKKKSDGDDLFDMLDTSKLNAHLKELMPGLTAKVFRTYNASITLDEMLSKKTRDGTLPEKVAVYQHANKEVAIICNHQRSVSKTHDAQMTRLNEKIDELKAQREELDVDLSRAKKGKPPLKDAEGKTKKNLAPEVLVKKLMQVDAKIEKMELDKKIKEDLKTVALGTSKINYLDPRITVAWCKRLEVPIEKIFNKSLLAKFTWAMDVEPSFRF